METISLLASEFSNCQCVLYYQITILSLTCTTVRSLTVDDFYNDTNADIVVTVSGSGASSRHDYPVHIISNLDFETVSRYSVSTA